MPAAVSELGLAADPAGGRVVLGTRGGVLVGVGGASRQMPIYPFSSRFANSPVCVYGERVCRNTFQAFTGKLDKLI